MPIKILLLLFFVLEISLLISIGAEIGILLTLLEFVLSAILGLFVVRKIGFRVLVQVNQGIKAGVTQPLDVMAPLLTVIAGVLLMMPGFASDFLGLLLSLPLCKTLITPRAQNGLNQSAKRQQNRQKTTRQRQSITIEQRD